jgi:hypothetical protein
VFLRFLINRSPLILAGIGVLAIAALGWFSYRYLYQSIAQSEAIATLPPPMPIEFIDVQRVERLDAFFRSTDALPTIDPTNVRDVFSGQTAPSVPKP